MIAFAVALFVSATASSSAPDREICISNSLNENVEFNYFVPGEPVPKGGYPAAIVEGGGFGCLKAPREPISILAKPKSGDAVSCNPSVVADYMGYYVARLPKGLVCEELKIQVPAQ